MKHPPIKIINITQTTDESALQKLITEKISRIITVEFNNEFNNQQQTA